VLLRLHDSPREGKAMASEVQERSCIVLSHEGTASTYTYDKNRRFPVEAGTRAAHVLVQFGGGHHYRLGIQNEAVQVAVSEWTTRWGELPWDLAQIVIHHFTIQVLVEVRVEPR
jgi:hypothetical protein